MVKKPILSAEDVGSTPFMYKKGYVPLADLERLQNLEVITGQEIKVYLIFFSEFLSVLKANIYAF